MTGCFLSDMKVIIPSTSQEITGCYTFPQSAISHVKAGGLYLDTHSSCCKKERKPQHKDTRARQQRGDNGQAFCSCLAFRPSGSDKPCLFFQILFAESLRKVTKKVCQLDARDLSGLAGVSRKLLNAVIWLLALSANMFQASTVRFHY